MPKRVKRGATKTVNAKSIQVSNSENDLPAFTLDSEIYNAIMSYESQIWNDKLPLFRINQDSFNEIVSYLTEEELFKVREVCKKMKDMSETAMKTRSKLVITREMNESTVEMISRYYTEPKHLFFVIGEVPISKLTTIFESQLASVDEFSVHLKSCEELDSLVAKCPKIKRLWLGNESERLTSVKKHYQNVCTFLKNFNNLEVISLYRVKLNAKCFESIPATVKDFSLVPIESDINCMLKSKALKLLKNLEKFSFVVREMDVSADISQLVKILNDVTTLKSLKIAVNSELSSLSELPNLEELELDVRSLAGDLTKLTNMQTLKKATLGIAKIAVKPLSQLLLNFTAVEELQLNFTHNNSTQMTNQVINALKKLRTMKRFILVDEECHIENYYISSKKYAFTELCKALDFVGHITICIIPFFSNGYCSLPTSTIKLYTHEKFINVRYDHQEDIMVFGSHADAVYEEIMKYASRKPNQKFEVGIGSYYFICEEEDMDEEELEKMPKNFKRWRVEDA
ncbi:hypothetical protein B4U80_13297 [Leptotrombidium deliense]|uniref:POU-specific domain-containing protein n=1 Tax=Leptotrombidium deliense TaxID=299467 RepID=A0A443S8P8_9ACAR|nr:hypothetical protein B4U80_13297 [Leptotrombidium deliense]